MSDHDSASKPGPDIPGPDTAGDDLARQRFFTIQAARLGGLALLLFGIVAINGRIGVPRAAGYGIVPVGLLLFAVLPVMLARRWHSRRS